MWHRITHGLALSLLVASLVFGQAVAGNEGNAACKLTEEDEMGPFYRPGAPLRSVLGKGYLLSGTVRSASDCSPLGAALVEFWMAGPDGHYSDAYRAAIITGATGRYRLETDYPGGYASRPIHIHIRASAPEFRSITTQHYPESGVQSAVFDLVLLPLQTP